jgi:glyoxylase-like metal-dependent hydrolase (beta-lactamase superfamily II)
MFEILRRDLILGAAGAYAAFGLDKAVTFVGAANAQPSTHPFRKYQIGDTQIFSLVDGTPNRPLSGSMVRNATEDAFKSALRVAGLPDDRVPLMFNVMAVKLRDQLVLIDSGTGNHPIYGQGNGRLLESMTAAGLDPKTVKTILVSHLHGDHIYGLMNSETNAQIFPDAELIVPAAELAFWTRPDVASMDFGPTRRGLAQRIQTTVATWKNVRPFEGEPELVPGIHAVKAPGHSPGHVVHLVSSGGQQFLITADVSVLTPRFATNPEWQAVLDQDPPMAVETRKRIFDRAVSDKLTLAGTHWLSPNVGTLAKDGNGYAFTPAE